MTGPEGGGIARQVGLIADICGAVSTIGIVIFAILNSRRIVNINVVQQPVVIGIIASAIAGITFLSQGPLVYFGKIHQFQRRSPWWNLTLGIFLLAVATLGWWVVR
jgi:hypothetical protein